MNACPDNNCPYAEKIEYMKKQSPTFKFDELSSKIKKSSELTNKWKYIIKTVKTNWFI